jgi:hypothetical protein
MLTPPMKMTLDRALSYIDDEWNRQLKVMGGIRGQCELVRCWVW